VTARFQPSQQSVCEGTRKTLDILAQWYQWFDRHSDLIILSARHRTSPLPRQPPHRHHPGLSKCLANRGRLDYLTLFKQLGVGIIQLTYNTQNYIGSGCYESHDSGLSDFGREVVAEMNRIGIAVDLSHVGSKTTDDTIEFGVPPKMMSQ
jgi:membrane dipeptidase